MMFFLEADQKRLIYEMQQSSYMHMLQMSNKMDDLFNLLSSLEISGKTRDRVPESVSSALGPGPEETLSSDSTSRITHEQKLIQLTRFKTLTVALEKNLADAYPALPLSTSSSLELNTEALAIIASPFTNKSTIRTAAAYNGVRVWVEWKYYLPQGLESTAPHYVEERVKRLATLLRYDKKPDEFRVPDCAGFIHQPEMERYGYVFQWPLSQQQQHQELEAPVSLYRIICSTKPPSLSLRVKMIRAIATSIWYLHTTNWLHKGLRSENIVFLDRKDLATPSLCGFEYSRPAEAGELTERPSDNLHHDLYRHPNAQFDLPREGARGFKKIYDVYSLGIVLLEIGLWEPIHSILGISNDRAITPRDVKNAWSSLVERRVYLDRLEAFVGEAITAAVVTCLSENFGLDKCASDEGNSIILQTAFGEKVIKRLDGVSI
jgi:hypothetical protein